MPDDGSLININFGDLSKTATVFVEKVCSAVGILYEPTHTKRMAKAETEAERIRALGRIETSALEHRALKRFVRQEARKQENIEQITSQAAKSLPEDAKVQDLDEDWVAHFFKQCDTVSDKGMQSLWARLLSGEATKSGTFSKRTVNFVSTLDKKDAALFTSFCQFVWHFGALNPIIYDVNDDIYKKHGINFTSLKHLDAIGLISFESMSGYIRKGAGKYWRVKYYGRVTLIEFPAEGAHEFRTGHALLTTTGQELMPVCGSAPNEEYYQSVLQKWIDEGSVLSSPLPQSKSCT